MRGQRIATVVVTAVLAGLAAAVVRVLRGGPAPAFSGHPSTDRPAGSPTDVVEATLAPVADVAASEVPAPEPDPVVVADAPSSDWVEAVAGTCPEGYPIKAKLRSGIYHVPGGAAYHRTSPDRCYRSPAAAQADGLRIAQR